MFTRLKYMLLKRIINPRNIIDRGGRYLVSWVDKYFN